MIDIMERKFLYLIENIMTKILRISGSGNGCHISCLHTEKQCQHCHDHQDNSSLYDVIHISLCDSHINDLCHLKRDQHFHKNFQNYKKRCHDRLLFVFSDRFQQCFVHRYLLLFIFLSHNFLLFSCFLIYLLSFLLFLLLPPFLLRQGSDT